MTPPRVAGVSMAPVAGNIDFTFDVAPSVGRAAGVASVVKRMGGPSLKVVVPQPPAGLGSPVPSVADHGNNNLRMMVNGGGGGAALAAAAPESNAAAVSGVAQRGGMYAEGRAVTLTRAVGNNYAAASVPEQEHDLPPGSPLGGSPLAYYREINETDSLW